MKKLLSIITLFVVFVASAQTSGFNYKALIADNGNALNTQAVDIKFTILQNGTIAVYQETQSTTTDVNGIITVNIGEGTVSSGTFSAIVWSDNDYYLKVEIDIQNGNGYQNFGTTQFKTVPYAKYAAQAGNVFSGSFTDLSNVPSGLADGDDDTQLTDAQIATMGYIKSANDADNDPTNEIELPATAVNGQVLTWNGTAWVAQNAGSGADNWGSQNVVSNTTLTGNGTSGNPLSIDTSSAAFNNWDKDVTDDFSGNYNDLTNKPTVFNVVATSSAATTVTDDVYHAGKIAIGTTSTDTVADEKLIVKTTNTSVKIGNDQATGYAVIAEQNTTSADSNGAIKADYQNEKIVSKIASHLGSPQNVFLGVDNLFQNDTGIAIGMRNRLYISSTSTSIPNYGIYNEFSGTGDAKNIGVYNTNHNTGIGDHFGIINRFTGDGVGQQIGVKNEILVFGDEMHYGSYSELSGSGSGMHIGNYTMLTGDGTGAQAGTVNFIDNTTDEEHTGVYNEIAGVGNGNQYAIKNTISNSGTGTQYGNYSLLSGDGSGYHFGTYNKLSGTGGNFQIGTNNGISNTGNGDHVGTMNSLSGTGAGIQVGVVTQITNSADGDHKGAYIHLSGEGTGEHVGVYTKFSGTGNGSHIGFENEMISESTGTQTGILNTIDNASTTTTSKQIGIKNVILSNSNNIHYAIYNSVSTTGTSEKYGNYTKISGVGIGDQYATYNYLTKSTPGNGDQYGSYNKISGSGIGDHYGVASYLDGTRTGSKYGVYSVVGTSAGGTHYAIYGQAKKAGSYAGYFVGNVMLNNKLLANDSGDADMKAYIYGSIASAGAHAANGAHSDGFTISHTHGTNLYRITFNNSPGSAGAYTVMVNMRFNQIGFITVKNNSDYFEVRTYDTTGGSDEKPFNFVVYMK